MTKRPCLCNRRVTRQVLDIEKGVCKLCGGDLLLDPSNSKLTNITEKAKLSDEDFECDDDAQHIYQVPSVTYLNVPPLFPKQELFPLIFSILVN